MRRALFPLLLALLLPAWVHAQDSTDAMPRFRVYTAQGEPASLYDVVMAMDSAEVVFVGEQHNDPVAHELQRSLLMQAVDQYSEERAVALSLEMFETDVQAVLDEYLAGYIEERHFLNAARPWNNYESDYRPLVEFAREHALPVIAANAPRRYINRVSRLGAASLEELPATSRAHLPPLPYPAASDAYRDKWNQLMFGFANPHEDAAAEDEEGEADEAPALPEGHPPVPDDAPEVGPDHGNREQTEADAQEEAPASPHSGGHAMPDMANLLHSQALWDATMAHSLARYLEAHGDALVLHMVGAFHVENALGTAEVLHHYRPGARPLVVVVRPVADPTVFDAEAHTGAGDFVILSDENLPRSFESPSF